MDKQLKSRFKQVLQNYADVIRERDAALLREKMAREQFETSFRAAVDNVILPAAATEALKAGGTPVDDAIETTPSFHGREPSISAVSLPPAPKSRFEKDPVNEPPSAVEPLGAETTPRRRSLDPEIVPPPPTSVRPHIFTPILIILTVGCAAIVGLTMISAFQPDAHPPKRTSESIPAAASTFNNAGSEPRLVVDVQKAFANEPLSLGSPLTLRQVTSPFCSPA